MKLSQHLTNFNHLQFVSILPELSLIKNLGEVFPGTNPGHAMGQRKWEKCGCAGFWNQSTLETNVGFALSSEHTSSKL